MSAYQQAADRFAEIHKLSGIITLLSWDSKVMMPAAATPSRGEQIGALAALLHARQTDPRLAEWLEAADQEDNQLDPWQRANLGEMKRLAAHARAVDERLAVAFATAKNTASAVWREARAKDDFAMFAPHLDEVLRLQIEIGEAKAQALGTTVYDALLDEHDPGTDSAAVARLFGEIETRLPPLVERIMARQRPPLPLPAVPVARQAALVRRILTRVGWPADGRIDHTEHPFALSGVPGDPRITTHYDAAEPTFALLAALHECGHGLYELNLPKNEYAYQPVGRHRGASTHESQSLGVEMQACRSDEFLAWLFPILRDEFGVSGAAWSDENLSRHYRRVRPSMIRVHADEVTYPLHIILRFNLEQAIVGRALDVAEIPDAWDAEMQRLLGIRPTRPSQGCLQDIHWSMGLVGYFPTYLLGALKAAQFFAAARRDEPGLLTALGQGDFEPWTGWLRRNVHRHASLYSSDELVRRATGRGLDLQPFIAHLEARYLGG